jgi:tetratricopeptide (TPR) repeat protein
VNARGMLISSTRVVVPETPGTPGAVVVAWLTTSDQRVEEGRPLVDLDVGGAIINIPAPVSGTLKNIVAKAGDRVASGATLAWVGTDEPVTAVAQALADRIESADDPSQALVRALLDVIESDDPELAEAVRVCAIPARVDAPVIALLSGVNGDRADELLAKVRELQFVRTRADGRYSYEQSTREALLRQWRQPGRRHRFVELNKRMLKHQESELARARDLEVDLHRIAPVVRRVNPSRYAQLADKIEGRVRGPLLEMLYHAAMVSSEGLYSLFDQFIQEWENRGRLLLCQSLLHATRSHMQEVDPASENMIWLDYWEGRLLQQLRADDEAERILNSVVNRTRDGEMVKQWALADLGYLRLNQDRLREAARLFRRELQLAEQTRVDPINLNSSCVRLADLEYRLGDIEAAVEHYREALSFSRTLPKANMIAEVAAWVGLGKALDRLGQSSEAIEAGLTAALRARTKLPSQPNQQASALLGLANILAAVDPSMSTTLYTEAQALTEDGGDSLQALEDQLHHIETLLEKGRPTMAQALLGAVRNAMHGQDKDDAELSRLEAMASAAAGNYRDAVDRLTRLLPREQPLQEWQRRIAITSRGIYLTACGRWREAEDDLAAAFRCWREAGSAEKMAGSKIALADLRRRRGDPAGAEAELAAAERLLADRSGEAAARLHRIRSDVLRTQGRAEDADLAAQEAVRRCKTLGRLPLLLEATLHQGQCSADRAAWAQAAGPAAHAASLGGQLDELDRWSPTMAQSRAARTNARGVRHLSEDRTDPQLAASQAVEFFAQAARMDPGNPWYQLNLACANAQLGRWEQATRAAELAVAHRGALAAPSLRACLLECRLRLAEVQAQCRDARAASTIDRAAGDVDVATLARLRIEVSRVKGDVLLLSVPVDTRSAESAYAEGLQLAQSDGQSTDEASFRGRLSVVAAHEGDIGACATHLDSALCALAGTPEDERADLLFSSCAAVLTTPDQYRTLGAALALVDESRATAAYAEPWLLKVRQQLAARWCQRLTGTGEPAGVTESEPRRPVEIEADVRLFPEGRRAPGLVRLFEYDTPALRERLREQTGIPLPPVRIVTVSMATPGAYTIRLHGTPVASGQVGVDSTFCSDARAARDAGLDGLHAVDPVTETDGVWLEGTARRAAEQFGLPLISFPEFLVRHLDSVVREELPALVGLKEVRRRFEGVPTQDGNDAWMGLRSADSRHRVRLLVSVVQALLTEGVPIHEPAAIAHAVEKAPAAVDPAALLGTVRLALRGDLTGRRRPGVFVRLRPESEATLIAGISVDGEVRLVLEPGQAEDLRRIVRSDLSMARPVKALLVSNSTIRPFVHRLIAAHRLDLPVLSQAEVSFPSPDINAAARGGVDA